MKENTNTAEINETFNELSANGVKLPKQPAHADKLSLRNLFSFALGTFGRDFLYNFFTTYLLTFVLFTKTLTEAQFSSISIIIICARIFDAFNDPIMGGVVENTRTKWGKYKPWQLIGCVLTGIVIIALFCVDLNGWEFIGFLAFAYFMFSITFTMNDISYWGMMPSLTSNEHDRNKLTSLAQLVASAGGGLVGLLVPMLTAGSLSIPGGAPTAYKIIAIVAALLMIAFQLITIFGVKEKPLPLNFTKSKRMSVKEMFKTIFKNDQLLWCTVIMLLWCIGPAVVNGGLGIMYCYFEFGYEGGLFTVFGIGSAVTSTIFTIIYPWISKKFGRNKIYYSAVAAFIAGYIIMMLFGLFIPSEEKTLKLTMMTIANAFVGFGTGIYMIMVINMANTVEYNEWKTGNREEGLIFSLRPFTAKLGSALMQGLIMLIYIVAGVLTFTNQISDLENQEAMGLITGEQKLAGINSILSSITDQSNTVLLLCMCLIPILFVVAGAIIYKKKCFLTEQRLVEMISDIEQRKAENETIDTPIEND